MQKLKKNCEEVLEAYDAAKFYQSIDRQEILKLCEKEIY